MPRKKGAPKLCSQGDGQTVVARGLCRHHYSQAKWRGDFDPTKQAAPVTASVAWPDPHHNAPYGQRLCLYKCPACGKDHLVSWAEGDENPGLKPATCGTATAKASTIALFNVLRPARVLNSPPEGYRVRSKPGTAESSGQNRVLAEMADVDFSRNDVSEQLDAAILRGRTGQAKPKTETTKPVTIPA